MDKVSGHDAGEKWRFERLVDAIADHAIFMLDPAGLVTTWNPGGQRMLGYTKPEIAGKNFACLFTEEDRAAGKPERLLDEARRHGRVEDEGLRVRKDGSRFWASSGISAVRDEKGELVAFGEIMRDVTVRREEQEALRDSERRFRMLVQGVVDYAIYMLDPSGRVTNWNSGAERIKGYSADEIVGQHFGRFYTPDDGVAGLPTRALEKAAREGKVEAEGWRVRKDGTRFWASVVIDAIRDETGELVGFAKVTRDISERREAQQRLEEAREQLFQSQKMETIGQLTGGVAHDFNNLLTVILGGADMAERLAGGNDRLKRILQNMRHAAKRGASLTTQLLAFARRQSLKPEVLDSPEHLHIVVGMLQRSLRGDIEIVTDVPSDLPPVQADPAQLELALLNIGLNARDAMPDGGSLRLSGRAVEIHDEALGLNGAYVAVALTDTGTGMPEELKARVFEPFFTTKPAGRGSGLGLSQVFGFAKQSGGSVTLESAVGKGTTVTMYLPVAPAGAGTAAQEPATGEEGSISRQTQPRILVVEDDPDVSEMVTGLLSEAGYAVRSVATAKAALDALRAGETVDAVFSDIMLVGGMNGAELAHCLREEFPGLPVLLATGYAEAATHALAKDFPVLSKPYDRDTLRHTLERVIPRSDDRRRAPQLVSRA